MKFSYKFLISTFLILVLFVTSNVIALRYYASEYFVDYIEDIRGQSEDFDIDFIDSILKNQQLDPDLIKEYKDITDDLQNVSDSLETFSKDPKPLQNETLIESLQKGGISSETIEQIIGTNAIQSFFSNFTNILTQNYEDPEGKFIIRTLRSMAVFNLFLVIVILLFTYAWITYSFRPIKAIINNLSNVIQKREYRSISYNKKDEFYPLIVALNNLNRNLSLQEKIRSDFLSDLSHEIKTPITAIKCYLEGIEDGVIVADEMNIKMLNDEIQRLIKITNTIMEFEKEESVNFGDLFIEKINYCDMVESIIEEYSPLLQKTKQESISYVPKKFELDVDKDKFMQLLHNIFSNFIKYAGKKSCLTIKAKNTSSGIVLSFKDNGEGIKEEELPFIKEKFYKTDKVRNKNTDTGIGIGLSVIQKIVDLHNGELEIKSKEGKGFEIKITLPK